MQRSALDFKRWVKLLAKQGLGYEDISVRLGVTKQRERDFIRSYYFEIEGNKDESRILRRMQS